MQQKHLRGLPSRHQSTPIMHTLIQTTSHGGSLSSPPVQINFLCPPTRWKRRSLQNLCPAPVISLYLYVRQRQHPCQPGILCWKVTRSRHTSMLVVSSLIIIESSCYSCADVSTAAPSHRLTLFHLHIIYKSAAAVMINAWITFPKCV